MTSACWRPARWLMPCLLALFALCPLVGLAATMPSAPSQVVVTPTSAPTIDNGLTAWMLVSSAFVLLMVPGLALFYGGMVRAKNVLNMFLCVMVAIGVIGLHWIVLGYAMTFNASAPLLKFTGGSGTVYGLFGFDPGLVLLRAFNGDYFHILTSGDATGAVATGVPELAFVMFQGKFAIITPALIVGAVAERIRFGPFILFMLVWSTIVYCPMAYNVWNVQGSLWTWGVLDFAGGTVVHILGGVSGLALALVVGPRRGYGVTPMPPHSLGLTLIGAGLLWFGWFGFNAGSAIAIPGSDLPNFMGISAVAFVATQVAAAAAATAWMCFEWFAKGKPTILGFASGMVAGLVVITPCAGHVGPAAALIIGLIGGAICYGGCQLKTFFKYDDSLDAFGVHGVGGFAGAVLVGVFAFRPEVNGKAVGGTMDQIIKQLVAAVIAVVFSFVVTYIIAIVIDKTIGLRVKPHDEDMGLDMALHGESGYHIPLIDMQGGVTAEGHPDARGSATA